MRALDWFVCIWKLTYYYLQELTRLGRDSLSRFHKAPDAKASEIQKTKRHEEYIKMYSSRKRCVGSWQAGSMQIKAAGIHRCGLFLGVKGTAVQKMSNII